MCLNGNQVPGRNLWTVTLAMFIIRVLLHDLCSNINGGSPTHFLNGSRGERKKTAAVNYLLHIFIDFSANRSLEWSFFFKRRVNKCNTINWSVWVDAFLLKTKYWHSILVLQNLYSLYTQSLILARLVQFWVDIKHNWILFAVTLYKYSRICQSLKLLSLQFCIQKPSTFICNDIIESYIPFTGIVNSLSYKL